MKKILGIIFIGIIILSFSSCGNSDNGMSVLSSTEQTNEILATPSPTDTPNAQSITETTLEPTSEPTLEPTLTSELTSEPTLTSELTSKPTLTSEPTLISDNNECDRLI